MTNQTNDYMRQISVNVIFTNEDGGNSKKIPLRLNYSGNRVVDANDIFNLAIHRGLNLNGAQIFLIDYLNRMKNYLGIFPFNENINIGIQNIVNDTIQISFKKMQSEMIDEAEEKNQVQTFQIKAKKVKERTILQAIESVKNWRNFYDMVDCTGKRMYTLEEAAKKVGIAKKTLDDYHVHLRIAYQFSFNIQRFEEHKIGILRKFVKIAKEEGIDGLQRKLPQCILDCNTDKYWVDFDAL